MHTFQFFSDRIFAFFDVLVQLLLNYVVQKPA